MTRSDLIDELDFLLPDDEIRLVSLCVCVCVSFRRWRRQCVVVVAVGAAVCWRPAVTGPTSSPSMDPYPSSSFVASAVGGCDNPPRKIPYYRLNQSTLVIKR
jgi:hypothetical protein